MDADKLIPIGKWFRFNPELVYKESTVVEIGAFDLEFADIILEHWPGCDYYVFEADYVNYNSLVAENKNNAVLPIHAAIAEHSGVVQFHRYNTKTASSLFKPDPIERERHKVIETNEVQSFTLKDIIDRVGDIDLLLLNCEGGELYALRPLFEDGLAKHVRQIGVSFHALQKIYPYDAMFDILSGLESLYDIYTVDERRGYYHLTLKD